MNAEENIAELKKYLINVYFYLKFRIFEARELTVFNSAFLENLNLFLSLNF